MKANDLLHGNTTGWQFETHVTTPRPSCLETHGAYLRLRRLRINCLVVIGGMEVYRVATTKPDCYRIANKRYTFAAALDILEGRKPLTGIIQLSLPMEAA